MENSIRENNRHRPHDVSKNGSHYIYFVDDEQKTMVIVKRDLSEMSTNHSTDEETTQDLVTRQVQRLLDRFRDNGPLSFRETEILTCAAVGKSNKQIAIIFGRSECTIKNHFSRILKKLGANDRTHAVTLALYNGWLPVLSDERGMEVIELFGAKNTKKTVEKEAVCQTCGLDCGDRFSLERHIDWGHKLTKSAVK